MKYFTDHTNAIKLDIERIKKYLSVHYSLVEDIPIVSDEWLNKNALALYNLYLMLRFYDDTEEFDLLSDIYPEILDLGLSSPKVIFEELNTNLLSLFENLDPDTKIKIETITVNSYYIQGRFKFIKNNTSKHFKNR